MRIVQPSEVTVSVGGTPPEFSDSADTVTTDFVFGNFNCGGPLFH